MSSFVSGDVAVGHDHLLKATAAKNVVVQLVERRVNFTACRWCAKHSHFTLPFSVRYR